jgi:hypothetical protein
MFFIDDCEEGLDFGVVALRPYCVRLLAANGLVALDEKNWSHQHTDLPPKKRTGLSCF